MRTSERHKIAKGTGELIADLVDEIEALKERVRDLEVARNPPSPRRSERIWFNTAQAAEHVGRHRVTIMKAAEAGTLHGTQRMKGGRWRFHAECLDAWLLGDECAHRS